MQYLIAISPCYAHYVLLLCIVCDTIGGCTAAAALASISIPSALSLDA